MKLRYTSLSLTCAHIWLAWAFEKQGALLTRILLAVDINGKKFGTRLEILAVGIPKF